MTTKALVKEFMTRHPVTVSGATSVLEAWTLMRDRRIRRLPVVEGQRVVGILTLGDLREAHAEETVGPGMRVNVLMHEDPITVTPESTLRQAAMIMVDKKISGLPVVSDGTRSRRWFRRTHAVWLRREVRLLLERAGQRQGARCRVLRHGRKLGQFGVECRFLQYRCREPEWPADLRGARRGRPARARFRVPAPDAGGDAGHPGSMVRILPERCG